MRKRLVALILLLCLSLGSIAVFAQEATPPATPGSQVPATPLDQADAGPYRIVGQLGPVDASTSTLYPNPTVALVDASYLLPTNVAEFAPNANQILGYPTAPLFTSETGAYQIVLPAFPNGNPFAIKSQDQPSEELQAFYLLLGSNVVGDSYLEGLEQQGVSSLTFDPGTGSLRSGALLVFAEDDRQVFPVTPGPDGHWFTDDDELMQLPAGYTVVSLPADGPATRDRSIVAVMEPDTGDDSGIAPDFSDMTWVDAFNALVDHLTQRYAYTEFRGIDWEGLRATFLPLIQQAQDGNDLEAYVGTLTSFGATINDAHVAAYPTTMESTEAYQAYVQDLRIPYSSGIGALGLLLSDPENVGALPSTGEFVIVTVGESGPAHDAGWVPGTQIVSINGQSIPEWLASIPAWVLGSAISTQEKAELISSVGLLLFPPGTDVTIEFIQPGESTVQTVSMVSGDYPFGSPSPEGITTLRPIETSSYASVEGYTVIKWADFSVDLTERIAVLEAALRYHHQQPEAKGIILDLRGNSGGWMELYEVMASYFFTPEFPMSTNVFDHWVFDEATGTFVLEVQPDYHVSSPRPELAYNGPLLVLIDQECVSSCEFFAQALQAQQRAVIVGQYASAGAGGNIDTAVMPNGMMFQYTQGRFTYAGTSDYNIEGKGVQPDVRIPVTLDGEVARLEGQDTVLLAAIHWLQEQLATPEVTPAATPAAS